MIERCAWCGFGIVVPVKQVTQLTRAQAKAKKQRRAAMPKKPANGKPVPVKGVGGWYCSVNCIPKAVDNG